MSSQYLTKTVISFYYYYCCKKNEKQKSNYSNSKGQHYILNPFNIYYYCRSCYTKCQSQCTTQMQNMVTDKDLKIEMHHLSIVCSTDRLDKFKSRLFWSSSYTFAKRLNLFCYFFATQCLPVLIMSILGYRAVHEQFK